MLTKKAFILSFALLTANIPFVGSTLSMARDLEEVNDAKTALKIIDSYVTKLNSEYSNNSWVKAVPIQETNLNIADFKKITKLQADFPFGDMTQSENNSVSTLGNAALNIINEGLLAKPVHAIAILNILKYNLNEYNKTQSNILSDNTIRSLSDALKTNHASFLNSDKADKFKETIKHYNLQ